MSYKRTFVLEKINVFQLDFERNEEIVCELYCRFTLIAPPPPDS